MVTCYCCDRRLADEPLCLCVAVYCRRCLSCGTHCGCLLPVLVEEEDMADEPVVIEPAQS